MSVPVSVILRRKGTAVHTVPPDATVAEAAQRLAEHGVGALVVSPDGATVQGIVSERDIVRVLAREGAASLDRPVREVMTAEVHTCEPDTSVNDLSATMTEHRVRHVPVLEGQRLAGIMSIGDVVKSRLDELEVQAQAMERYVTGSQL